MFKIIFGSFVSIPIILSEKPDSFTTPTNDTNNTVVSDNVLDYWYTYWRRINWFTQDFYWSITTEQICFERNGSDIQGSSRVSQSRSSFDGDRLKNHFNSWSVIIIDHIDKHFLLLLNAVQTKFRLTSDELSTFWISMLECIKSRRRNLKAKFQRNWTQGNIISMSYGLSQRSFCIQMMSRKSRLQINRCSIDFSCFHLPKRFSTISHNRFFSLFVSFVDIFVKSTTTLDVFFVVAYFLMTSKTFLVV